jgi:DNA-binding CsgD family transcriptional regulator
VPARRGAGLVLDGRFLSDFEFLGRCAFTSSGCKLQNQQLCEAARILGRLFCAPVVFVQVKCNLRLKAGANAETRQKLFISSRTVESHRANLMKKLSLTCHTDLVRFVIRRKIIAPVKIGLRKKGADSPLRIIRCGLRLK